MTIGPLLVAMLVAAQASPARPAAVHRSRGYASGSVALAYHPASSVYYRDIITPVHGAALDFSGGGGFFFTPALAVEGELVYGGAVSTSQYTFYEEKVRDVMLNALVRLRPQDMPRLQLLAGVGRAWTHAWEEPPQSRSPVPEGTPVFALTFGADVLVVDARHVGVAPSFRVRWLHRDLYYGSGLGRTTYQIGATIFVR